MAERNENMGTPNGGAQGKTTPASTERTAENRENATHPGQGTATGQSGKPGGEQARERGEEARPTTGRTGDEDVATDEEQDEQGDGKSRKEDGASTEGSRAARQGGLNTGEEEGDLDVKRTTTGNDAERMQQGGNSGKAAGANTNNPR